MTTHSSSRPIALIVDVSQTALFREMAKHGKCGPLPKEFIRVAHGFAVWSSTGFFFLGVSSTLDFPEVLSFDKSIFAQIGL